jgi:hypothetical protein
VQLNNRRVALAAVLCATSLSATLASASPSPANPPGCRPRPSWIESATLPTEGQGPFQGCFSSNSSQAEALLSIANNRPYAQLITVSGTQLDLPESSFAGSLEGALSRLLASLRSGMGRSAFLLSPGARARLAIDRPAPGEAQRVNVDPAPVNAFAVGALAWTLLSTAAKHRSLPTATLSCIAVVVYASLSSPSQPEEALRRMHACVNASRLSRNAERLLRKLASRLLRGRFFREVIHREGTEHHPARIAFQISPSNPNLINPAIHLGPASFGTLPAGRRTVEHLSASGGTPPYRFYIVPEPGGPGVPPWLHLAADGTLTLETPPGSATVSLPVEVVDSNGEHSVVPY